MNPVHVTVRFFGAFRAYGRGVDLSVPDGARVGAVRAALIAALPDCDPALVHDSVFSDDLDILGEDALVRDGACLAVLPPVCGG